MLGDTTVGGGLATERPAEGDDVSSTGCPCTPLTPCPGVSSRASSRLGEPIGQKPTIRRGCSRFGGLTSCAACSSSGSSSPVRRLLQERRQWRSFAHHSSRLPKQGEDCDDRFGKGNALSRAVPESCPAPGAGRRRAGDSALWSCRSKIGDCGVHSIVCASGGT